ncbi:hydroxyethylthiazole kinase [Treponema sp.]|uniref:hydroxyethylthiazole kinase n=1 Tax=Treponema sp. TaxID=166 RepID=UPI0025F702AE|nr:hydroxyethylthiazole kinase [Treponema sp.]MCR5217485.1 hydroxyethylthiazole kinase [Treponema sp.]
MNIIKNVREAHPLVHCMTNYVTVNDVANVVLASGASPIMSDDKNDVKDITSICNGLCINIGTLNSRTIKSMLIAGQHAQKLGHLLVLDPVGAGASKLRTKTALKLIKKIHFDVIRGNISEIKTLAGSSCSTQGVDANDADQINENNLYQMIEYLKTFAIKSGSIIAVTGKTDIVTDGKICYVIKNGDKAMKDITGTGCQLSALLTAFICANKKNKLEAAAMAVCTMGLAGQIAKKNLAPYEGNASYAKRIIDAVYNMTDEMLQEGALYEIK